MRVMTLHDQKNNTVYVHCEKILYFRAANVGGHTMTEINFTDGEPLIVKETAQGIRDGLHCN